MEDRFLSYHEPSITQILIVTSFFFFLPLSEFIALKIFRAGLLGNLVVGIVYGVPLANILVREWQETFLVLGYVGLILVVFEGGLGTRMDLLRKNLVLSGVCAVTGIMAPIGSSLLVLALGFGYGLVESFIVGAALSSTSLGTTFAVISAAKDDINLAETRVGTVLITAAMIDDVVALIMASVIRDLGSQGITSLGWTIGKPIMVSVLMAIFTPLAAKYVFKPVFDRWLRGWVIRYGQVGATVFMVLMLCGFITVANYAGTSVLFGAFLAGITAGYVPSSSIPPAATTSPDTENEAVVDMVRRQELDMLKIYESGLQKAQNYLLAPLFFSSVGFAVPFTSLWSGIVVWRGILFSLIMLAGKFLVGAWIPIIDLFSKGTLLPNTETTGKKGWGGSLWPASLLGSAMIARGEIGLLIIQVGFNAEAGYLGAEAFAIGIWAILLNTIIGPTIVGVIVERMKEDIARSRWGIEGK